MPPVGISPYEVLLCERSPRHAAEWQEGFKDAALSVLGWPEGAKAVHEIVSRGLSGEETARLLAVPYVAYNEGLWHGVYGEVEYQNWKAKQEVPANGS